MPRSVFPGLAAVLALAAIAYGVVRLTGTFAADGTVIVADQTCLDVYGMLQG